MDELVQIQDQFYILTTSSRVDDRTRVLKQGESFAVLDRFGEIAPVGMGELGLYHEGTRFLSRHGLRFAGRRPLLLSSTLREDNAMFSVHLTNPDLWRDDQLILPRGTIHIARELLLWNSVFYERLRLRNYGTAELALDLALTFDADYRDIFEVRGMRRERSGRKLETCHDPADPIVLRYEGLDQVQRRTRIRAAPQPDSIEGESMRFGGTMQPGEEREIRLAIACDIGPEHATVDSFDGAAAGLTAVLQRGRAADCHVDTSNELLNDWLNRSSSDLHMMLTDGRFGPFPYAGVPWYSTPFGRDALITALQTLWLNPDIARAVLGFLSATQAATSDAARDAEPGKILHEMRRGEMAALGEIPFGCYYGTVDATPLFVMLAGAWFARTGDREFLVQLWPHVERALDWMDGPGDSDGDGFLDYCRHTSHGLVHQGWKDSQDSVFHADGALAEPPIALCEVQAYAWAARRAAAGLASALGDRERARELRERASVLRQRFEQAFWCEDLGTYALALDATKRRCRVRTSNAGHCLFAGIASPARAQRIAGTLLSPTSFSGWGVRTVDSREARYNPMSYHNGSVWPHDNAMLCAGLARYGLKSVATRILAGLFDASLFLDLRRLPELFCGFDRRPGEGPTLYPVACSPQAWASAAPFMVLEACLGLRINAAEKRVSFIRPVLPDFMPEVKLTNLRVGEGSVDVLLRRHLHDVGINVIRREGPVEVVVTA